MKKRPASQGHPFPPSPQRIIPASHRLSSVAPSTSIPIPPNSFVIRAMLLYDFSLVAPFR